jgi:hypothetical protein
MEIFLKNSLYLSKIKGAHSQCIYNHCGKIEWCWMQTVVITDYTN